MASLRYASLCACYGFEYESAFSDTKLKERICFSDIRDTHSKEPLWVKIVLYKDTIFVEDTDNNNYCPFTMDEIKNYLNYLKQFNKFEYELYEFTNPERSEYDPGYAIELKFAKCEHENMLSIEKYNRLFVLTAIRYLFEYPFTLILFDALYLQNHIEEFKDFGLFNTMNLVMRTYCYSDNHAIASSYVGYTTDEEFKSRSEIYSSVQKRFNEAHGSFYIFTKRDENTDEFDYDNTIDRINAARKDFVHNIEEFKKI